MPPAQSSTVIPSFALDPGDLDLADDLAEEAETIPTDRGSQETIHPSNKRSREDENQSVVNILEAASQAVQIKTKLAYKGYAFSDARLNIADPFPPDS